MAEQLQPADFNSRKTVAREMLALLKDSPHVLKDLLFTDEIHFHLSGFINRQNMRYWAPNNPYKIVEKPLHIPKMTVWCAVGMNGIIGSYFLKMVLANR